LVCSGARAEEGSAANYPFTELHFGIPHLDLEFLYEKVFTPRELGELFTMKEKNIILRRLKTNPYNLISLSISNQKMGMVFLESIKYYRLPDVKTLYN
jgi:hypothetical protein